MTNKSVMTFLYVNKTSVFLYSAEKIIAHSLLKVTQPVNQPVISNVLNIYVLATNRQ